MPNYEFRCENCGTEFERILHVDQRNVMVDSPCPWCGEYTILRMISKFSSKVMEGSCGNAANGYSSTHGDSENFKARDLGQEEVYKK